MDFGHVPTPLDTLACAYVRVGDGRESLLVLPQQVRDVAHGDGDNEPAGADAQRHGERGAQENVAVPSHDAARHGSHEHVDEAGHELLAALARGRQGCDGRREGVLQVEGPVYGGVDAILGRYGLLVQEQTGLADLRG